METVSATISQEKNWPIQVLSLSTDMRIFCMRERAEKSHPARAGWPFRHCSGYAFFLPAGALAPK
jgi:hypothetical protein